MTLVNMLKERVMIQTRTITLGALGETEVWSKVSTKWCRRVPVKVETALAYQQLETVVTDKFIFRGTVEVNIGEHRLVSGSQIYKVVISAKHIKDKTEVVVEKI